MKAIITTSKIYGALPRPSIRQEAFFNYDSDIKKRNLFCAYDHSFLQYSEAEPEPAADQPDMVLRGRGIKTFQKAACVPQPFNITVRLPHHAPPAPKTVFFGILNAMSLGSAPRPESGPHPSLCLRTPPSTHRNALTDRPSRRNCPGPNAPTVLCRNASRDAAVLSPELA